MAKKAGDRERSRVTEGERLARRNKIQYITAQNFNQSLSISLQKIFFLTKNTSLANFFRSSEQNQTKKFPV
jgi:hypothetical protein